MAGIERSDVVEASVQFSQGSAPANLRVLDPQGNAVPSQVLSKSDDGRTLKILFLARVPSVGLAVYDVQSTAEHAAAPAGTPRSGGRGA